MFTKILVPLDGSMLAEKALLTASKIAAAYEAEMLLLQVPVTEVVLADPVMGYGIVWPEDANKKVIGEAADYLEELIKRPIFRNLSVRPLVYEGDAAATIVDTAVEEGVDLIVMTTHGYSGMTRWLLGSVTEKVLQKAACPVLALREDTTIKHILITLDESDLSEIILEPAAKLARALNAKVTLLEVANVYEQIDPYELAAINQIEKGIGEQIIRGYYDAASDYLERVCHFKRLAGVDVKKVVMRGNPADNILNFIDNNEIDLIAMATHGRTGLRRWIYGSVTEKILRGGHKSMLIARP